MEKNIPGGGVSNENISNMNVQDDDVCCALCLGVVDWHNCDTVRGLLECGSGLVSTLETHPIHYPWEWGPSNVVV